MRAVVQLCWVSVVALCLAGSLFASEPHKMEAFKSPPPKGLSDKIAAQLDENAVRVIGPNGPVCEIWLIKEVATKDDFKPTLTIKYPFTSGQLLGAVRLPTAGAALDFRGQELAAGVYTLRYGLQPQDGNHLGSSDTSDFGLACSAELDKDPAPVAKIPDLFKLSAKASGSAHPAIFQMIPPPAEPYKETVLKHNADKDLWILRTNFHAKVKGKTADLPTQLVVVGTSDH